ncbi:MAG: hypothetical protein EXS60_01905 [Candidatus Pacebacteria bacterium]|nr:hypothetical protein [Candidatus Paceibacterota bacterium]
MKKLLLFSFLVFAPLFVFAEDVDLARETAAIRAQNEQLAREISILKAQVQTAQALRGRIVVEARDPKIAKEIKERVIWSLMKDPAAVKVALGDPRAPVVLNSPLIIRYDENETRCHTQGGRFSMINGKPSCSVSILVAPHSTGKGVTREDAYKWMIDECLLHEALGHSACYMRLGGRAAQLPLWVMEGTAMLYQSPKVLRSGYVTMNEAMVKSGGLPFSMNQLSTMSDYPPNKDRQKLFYYQSMALADMLVGRITELRGPEANANDYPVIVMEFTLAVRNEGWRAAMQRYAKTFGFDPAMTAEQLDQKLREHIEDKKP